jgi:PKD repeat protein
MKKLFTHLFSAAFFCCVSLLSIAQEKRHCGTDEHFAQQLQENPNLINQVEEFRYKLQKRIAEMEQQHEVTNGNVKIIPVVFHVIHECDASNISKEQIEDAVRVINQDFRRKNADTTQTRAIFRPHAADLELEFRLAKIDPNGNCTEGITRTFSSLTNQAGNAVKSLISWPSNKYLNIWVVKSIGTTAPGSVILGYAEFPSASTSSTYGVVVRHDETGTIGTAVGSQGRTLTHEIGHCFELFHTFQGACGTNCATSGDRVCDTPPSFDQSFGCSANENTCSNDTSGGTTSNPNPYTSNVPDQIENYMSYNSCQNMFSKGQKTRVLAALSMYPPLINLTSAANLAATGTNDGYVATVCEPIANFCVAGTTGCLGLNLSFNNTSYNSPRDSTQYVWSFPGGTPSSFVGANPPMITYNAVGTYGVTLVASTAAGADTFTRQDLVTVAPVSQPPIREGFENPAFPLNPADMDKSWKITTESNAPSWERVTTAFALADASVGGGASVRIRNNLPVTQGKVRELISPNINMVPLVQPRLRFRYASAKRLATSTPSLRVSASTNCGATWITLQTLEGDVLETRGTPTTQDFVPTATQWKSREINLNAYTNRTQFAIKFEMINPNLSNSVYLDNVRIQNNADPLETDPVTNLDVSLAVRYNLMLYPNPITEQTVVGYTLPEASTVRFTVVDMLGKAIQEQETRQTSGNHEYELGQIKSTLKKGMYLLKVQINDSYHVIKFSVL